MDKFADIMAAARKQYTDVKKTEDVDFVMYAIASTQMAVVCELFHKGSFENHNFLKDNLFSVAVSVLYFMDVLRSEIKGVNGDILDAVWDDVATYPYSWDHFKNLYVDFNHDWGLMYDFAIVKERREEAKRYVRYAFYCFISIAGMFLTKKEFYDLMMQEGKR